MYVTSFIFFSLDVKKIALLKALSEYIHEIHLTVSIENVFLFTVKLMQSFALGKSELDIHIIKEIITPGILINIENSSSD